MQGVFCVGEAPREADGEEGRVVVYDLGVGEGGEVCGGAWGGFAVSIDIGGFVFVGAVDRVGVGCTYRPLSG